MTIPCCANSSVILKTKTRELIVWERWKWFVALSDTERETQMQSAYVTLC